MFDVQPGATVALSVQTSLFSRPAGAPGPAVVIRQAGGGDVTREFGDNRFQGFATFQTDGDFDKPWPGTAQLLNSPWKEADPLADLRQYDLREDAQNRVAEAFQVRDAWPVLRTAADASRPVGVETLGAVNYVETLQKAQAHRLIVEPGKHDSANRIYGSLEEAVSAAAPGEEILLRSDDRLSVKPIRQDKGELTIRPEDYRHPQLCLASPEAETAMFRVFDGCLRLEGMEFRLQSPDTPAAAPGRQSVIELVGQGQCFLRNCVVTLDRSATDPTRLAAVWVSDPKVMMKSMQPASPPPPPPLLHLDGCFVRGDGDFVVCPTSRPLTVEATSTLAALKGSFLSVESAGAPPGAGDQVALKLDKVTTYLTGNLVRLRAKDYQNLTPVHCSPSNCLFVAAGKAPLIQLDDSDLPQVLENNELERILTWQGTGRIDYGNFAALLDQTPPTDQMPQQIKADKWESVWGKNMGDNQVAAYHWAGSPPSADDPFGTAAPGQFRPDPSEACGADVDALVRDLPPTAAPGVKAAGGE